MGTGLIVAFVVTVWAAYFVPLALRRYDEAHEQSVLETLSPLSRVIRRSPDPDQLSAEVDHVEVAPVESQRDGRSRYTARLAARRRRRVLITLVVVNAIVGGLAGPTYAVIPLWSIAIPMGLLVAWLVACRIQVRHEYGIAAPRVRIPNAPKVPKRLKVSKHGSPAAQSEDTVEVFLGANVEDIDPTRRHVMEDAELEEDALEEHLVIAVPSAASHGEMVWDPLPVTLPTYVTKPRAGRTVRTIDFDAPGAWTSGHVEGEEVELPASEASSDGSAADAQRHAAGL